MFAKIYEQIFDSSIAEDYQVRHLFMDLLVLADQSGVIDMTHQAIARRTNIPIEIVKSAIETLCSPDPESRTRDCDGRRLILCDDERGWGWRIVNYLHYRNMRDEEARRSYMRELMRNRRKRGSVSTVLAPVSSCKHPLANAEAEAEAEAEKENTPPPPFGGVDVCPSTTSTLSDEHGQRSGNDCQQATGHVQRVASATLIDVQGHDSGQPNKVAHKPNTSVGTDDNPQNLTKRQIACAGWFKRTMRRKWSDKELAAWKKNHCEQTESEDWETLSDYYKGNYRGKRTDLITLLNNWPGEIDRSKNPKWASEFSNGQKPKTDDCEPKPPRDWFEADEKMRIELARQQRATQRPK